MFPSHVMGTFCTNRIYTVDRVFKVVDRMRSGFVPRGFDSLRISNAKFIRVSCFNVGNFCGIAGCQLVGPNGIISSETTSGGEAGACLRAFCCGTFFLWLLSIVLLATKFESPVCESGLM